MWDRYPSNLTVSKHKHCPYVQLPSSRCRPALSTQNSFFVTRHEPGAAFNQAGIDWPLFRLSPFLRQTSWSGCMVKGRCGSVVSKSALKPRTFAFFSYDDYSIDAIAVRVSKVKKMMVKKIYIVYVVHNN